MNNSDVLKARTDYCIGKTCRNCIFRTYAIKFNTRCCYLTIDQIYEILQLIKEEKSMTKKEEIQQEIEKTQKQLAALQEKLKEAENEVPEVLEFKDNNKYWYVDGAGNVCWASYMCRSLSDATYVHRHRAFLSEEYAEEFAKKTQFIADMLYFKYLYDRDYKPDWKNGNKPKWYVVYNGTRYECDTRYGYEYRNPSGVYFSSEEIAKKCADWLNKKKVKE